MTQSASPVGNASKLAKSPPTTQQSGKIMIKLARNGQEVARKGVHWRAIADCPLAIGAESSGLAVDLSTSVAGLAALTAAAYSWSAQTVSTGAARGNR